MNTTKKNELISESNYKYVLCRFAEGMKHIKNNTSKRYGILVILVLVLLTDILIQRTFVDTIIGDTFKIIIHLLFFIIALIAVLCYILNCGTPLIAHYVHNNFARIGLTNAAGEIPLLLREYPFYKKSTSRQVFCLEFISCDIEKTIWESKKTAIETALNRNVAKIEEIDGKQGIRLYTVPLEQGLSDKIVWKNTMLDTQIPICKIILGESLLEQVTVDLNITPHILIGGSTGSGKTVLLRLILMQLLRKQNVQVTIADFKGGVDFSTAWGQHPKCRMILERSELLSYLDALIIELNRRKALFASKNNCNNIFDYNINPIYTHNDAEPLERIVFAADEIAEILDKTGLSKTEKEVVAQIESRLATVARLGRAFGIHLILATQRPDANILCGQIKNNISHRICGRADNVLSGIILDSTAAADEIPSDARGRFIDNNGVIFQSYWFDESDIDWNTQI